MTASEPTAMTLEEGMKAVAEGGCRLEWIPNPPGDNEACWGLWRGLTFEGPFSEWPEATSHALGYSVVARDEAAELRAAITEWAEATSIYPYRINPADPEQGVAEQRVEAAEAVLRRLIGMENET